jgi:hypothetical protein
MAEPRKTKISRINKAKEIGVTKKDFHALIEKASQPIKHEVQSDSEKSET